MEERKREWIPSENYPTTERDEEGKGRIEKASPPRRYAVPATQVECELSLG